MLRVVVCVFACCVLAGCDQAQRALGLKSQAPDEFTVAPRTTGLEVPPDLDVLPSPQEGKSKETTPFPSLQKGSGHTKKRHTLAPQEERMLKRISTSEKK